MVEQSRHSHQTPTPAGGGSEEVRVREIWNQFATWMRDDMGYAVSTRQGYMSRVQSTHRWLRNNGHPGIHVATAETLRLCWDDQKPTVDNRNHFRTALLAFFRFTNDKAWRPDNPALALPVVKRPKRNPRPLLEGDAQKLLDVADACSSMQSAMVALFLFTGIRRAELRNAQWADLDGHWLTVIGKGDKQRTVWVHEEALVRLQRWRLESKSAGWIFTASRRSDKPVPNSTLGSLMREVRYAAGVEFTPHILRHTMATTMLETTDNVRAVQEILGHASPATTALYTKVRPAKVKEVAEKLTYH